MLGENAVKKLDVVMLSNNAVQRIIEDISSNIESQVIKAVAATLPFSIQLDKSTNVYTVLL